MNAKTVRARVIVVTLCAGVVMLLANACQGGNEGDRCNPKLSHDECGAGLSCQQPGTCVENYCCPANLASSTSSFCRGESCPPAATDAAAGPADAANDAPTGGPTDGSTNS